MKKLRLLLEEANKKILAGFSIPLIAVLTSGIAFMAIKQKKAPPISEDCDFEIVNLEETSFLEEFNQLHSQLQLLRSEFNEAVIEEDFSVKRKSLLEMKPRVDAIEKTRASLDHYLFTRKKMPKYAGIYGNYLMQAERFIFEYETMIYDY